MKNLPILLLGFVISAVLLALGGGRLRDAECRAVVAKLKPAAADAG